MIIHQTLKQLFDKKLELEYYSAPYSTSPLRLRATDLKTICDASLLDEDTTDSDTRSPSKTNAGKIIIGYFIILSNDS